MDYGTQFPPGRIRTKKSKKNTGSQEEPRGEGKAYLDDGKGRIVGEVRLARGWNPIGHTVR
jgi:hypothetical protein